MEAEVRINVIKRNGQEVEFDITRAVNATETADREVDPIHQMNPYQVQTIADKITTEVMKIRRVVNAGDIQEMVEIGIMEMRGFKVAQGYIRYRYKRGLARNANTTNEGILPPIDQANEEVKQESSNKNPITDSTQRDYVTDKVLKDLVHRILLPEEIVKAYEEGLTHFHDSDYYVQYERSCDLINLRDILQNGTAISETMIEKPHNFFIAYNVTTRIVAQVASNQYGSQPFTPSHLAPFVDMSHQKIHGAVFEERTLCGESAGDETVDHTTGRRLQEETRNDVQTIQCQLITLMIYSGQILFITMFVYLDGMPEGRPRDNLAGIIYEVLLRGVHGMKDEKSVWIAPAFPELICMPDEGNITEDAPYWELTELVVGYTSRRLVPGYVSAKKMREYKNDSVLPCMSCHSFLTPDLKGLGKNGKRKYRDHFNQGIVTIDLADITYSSYGDTDKFWGILGERLELYHRALRYHHEGPLDTAFNVTPILWRHGALARSKRSKIIDKFPSDNYPIIPLGYTSLYEIYMRMTGKSHTDEKAGHPFALRVIQCLNKKCEEQRAAEGTNYSIYGTSTESTTYKFTRCLQKHSDVIPGVMDGNYITNSYHVHVSEKVDAFRKLSFETGFQKLSPDGTISYVKMPNLQNNTPTVLSIACYIYDHIVYVELNTKNDYYRACGYDGEIKIRENENDRLVQGCPSCGNRSQEKLFAVWRTCSYIGIQSWDQGRTQGIRDRVLRVSAAKREADCKSVAD